MPPYDPEALPDEVDVDHAYQIALGRTPTTVEMTRRRAMPMGKWVSALFASEEFAEVRKQVARREPIARDSFKAPLAALTGWAASFFPLSLPSRVEVATATSWYRLYLALFSDPRFRRRIARDWTGLRLRSFLIALQAGETRTLTTVGAITGWTPSEVTGWIMDRGDLSRSPMVELYIDDRFIAAGVAGATDAGVGPRGTEGMARHFTISSAVSLPTSRETVAEVRESGSGRVISRFALPDLHPPTEAVSEIRGELARLREMLDRIEAKLPNFTQALGFPLEAWGEYFAMFYAPAHRQIVAGSARADLAVIIDATRATRLDLASSLASVAAQGHRPRAIVVIHSGGDTGLDCRTMLIDLRARLNGVVIEERAAEGTRAVAMVVAELDAAGAASMLLMPACLLAPDAVGLFEAALATSGARLAYADSDSIEGEAWQSGRHVRPVLRSGPDATLALQQDLCGEVVAVRRDALAGAEIGSVEAWQFALSLHFLPSERAVVHVPRVLYHLTERLPAVPVGDRLARVRDHLSRTAPGARAEPVDEGCHPATPGLLRVRFPIPEGTRAAIIVPTRDRADLLASCLASIEASIEGAQAAFEIVIVDNRSQEAATKSLFDRVGRLESVRILPHDAGFNWASINNDAARQIDADVLIFLNNDTVALSVACWDELVSQALRPEVGAVGACLLYADGTVQHAGVVLDQWHSFASHEGVGDDGSASGYLGRRVVAREVAMVTGACLATRASVFHEVGGFDAGFFPVEGNDTDYCLRLRAAGYRIVYAGQASLYHFESKTRGDNDDELKQRRAFEATQALRARWAKRFAQDPYYNPHFDRLAQPFRRLVPPPAGVVRHASTD